MQKNSCEKRFNCSKEYLEELEEKDNKRSKLKNLIYYLNNLNLRKVGKRYLFLFTPLKI